MQKSPQSQWPLISFSHSNTKILLLIFEVQEASDTFCCNIESGWMRFKTVEAVNTTTFIPASELYTHNILMCMCGCIKQHVSYDTLTFHCITRASVRKPAS